jgi:hypothetical protein
MLIPVLPVPYSGSLLQVRRDAVRITIQEKPSLDG